MHLWRFNLHKTNAANEELVISLKYGRKVQGDIRYPIAPSLYSLSNKMDNSLLAVRDITHKYIVVGSMRRIEGVLHMREKNPAVMNAVKMMKEKYEGRHYYFYGDAQREMKCKPVSQFPGITNLIELFAVLERCWAKDTAYPSCQAEWVPNDPSFGQCAITATLVYDMFGGTIHKIKVSGGGTHYFNKLNGTYVDFTREQFDLYDIPLNYEPNQEVPREYCGKNKDTLDRYHQLQRNIIKYLSGGLGRD